MVDACKSCARNNPRYKSKRPIQVVPPSEPLDFVAMNILGQLPRTASGKQHVVVIMDRYSKLTRAISKAKTTATHDTNVFFDHWVVPYDIPKYHLTGNSPQFVSKFFETICTYLGVKQLTNTAYHSQAIGQVERYNKTIVTRLRHYVAEHQKDREIFDQRLTYVYNTHVHRSTNTTPFSLVLSRHPPGRTLLPAKQAYHTYVSRQTSVQATRRALEALIHTLPAKADAHMCSSQQRYKRDYDKLVRVTSKFTPGDMVFVDRSPLSATVTTSASAMANATYNKLLIRALGPFHVNSVQPHTLTIEEDGIPNTISIDRATRAPTVSQAMTQQHEPNDELLQERHSSPETSHESTARRGNAPKQPSRQIARNHS